MTALVLDPQALEDYLPHRGVNLIADQVTIDAEGRSAVSTTLVPDGDVRGRELLGRRNADGERVWYEPFIAETLAITGVTLLREQLAPRGLVGVFSAIGRSAFRREARQDREVLGECRIKRERGDFWQFEARFSQDGETVWEAEIMSGAAPLAEIVAQPVHPADPGPLQPLQADFGWKHPSLRFLDGVVEADAQARRLVCAYTYPEDHPFVPTHFPGGALMMGVTQWAALADAAWEAAARFGCEGSITVSGAIARPDGGEIIDVRDLALRLDGGIPVFTTTKRVAFRGPVRPGDTLLVTVEVAEC